jgi:hypothetical protein
MRKDLQRLCDLQKLALVSREDNFVVTAAKFGNTWEITTNVFINFPTHL